MKTTYTKPQLTMMFLAISISSSLIISVIITASPTVASSHLISSKSATGLARLTQKQQEPGQEQSKRQTEQGHESNQDFVRVPLTNQPAGTPKDFDAILQKYVDGDFFNYKSLKANMEDLNRFERFLKWQAEADVESMSRNEQIAFYINAYNSCCIKAILDHYPVHTPKDIDGFFDKLKFKIAGEYLTIEEIEYDRLIAKYKDMRAHFAVVCADRGCLPLKASAYTGDQLNRDLEAVAKRFVQDPRHFKVDHENRIVHVSKIFEWYGPKFLKDPTRPVKSDRPVSYLSHWTDKKTRKLLQSGKYQLKIIEWNWTINEK